MFPKDLLHTQTFWFFSVKAKTLVLGYCYLAWVLSWYFCSGEDLAPLREIPDFVTCRGQSQRHCLQWSRSMCDWELGITNWPKKLEETLLMHSHRGWSKDYLSHPISLSSCFSLQLLSYFLWASIFYLLSYCCARFFYLEHLTYGS